MFDCTKGTQQTGMLDNYGETVCKGDRVLLDGYMKGGAEYV